jgi:Tol biopolymer transport system component
MLSFALSCGLTVAAAGPPPGNTGASRPRGPIDWISWSPGPKIVLDAGNANLAISGGGATRRLFPPSGFENAVWTPSGRLLAASSDKGVVVAFPTGKPLRRVARSGHFPRWSPTGSTLAFQTFGSPGPGAIWTVGVDGRRKRQLVTTLRLGPDFDRGPVWSPDGRRLAFGACLRRVPEGQGCGGLRRGIGVFTIRVDGTGRRRVAYGSCPDWSPGRRIALSTDMGIALVNGDGSGRRIVASRPVSCPVWSPNGRSVAAEGARSLLVVASGARRARRVGKLPALPTCCDYPHPPAPAWSPDGTQIAVVRAVEDGSARLAYRLYVVRVDDGHTRLILMTPYSHP